jgi:hypothetical protein
VRETVLLVPFVEGWREGMGKQQLGNGRAAVKEKITSLTQLAPL